VDRRIRRRMAVTAAAVGGGLLLARSIELILARLSGLLIMCAVAVFLSLSMEPAVAALERRRWRRGAATGVVMVAMVSFFGGLVFTGGALIAAQADTLVESAPDILSSLEARLGAWGIDVQLGQLADPGGPLHGLTERLGAQAVALSGKALGSMFATLTLLFIVFYLSADGPRLVRLACSLVSPERQQHVYRAWELGIEKAGGYLYVRLILAVVASIAHALAFMAIGVEYPIPLGIWVGVVSQAIPVLGTYLGGALPVVIALVDSPVRAVLVLATLVVYQQVENLGIAPKLTRNTIQVHPLMSFLSVLAGASLLGWAGAIIAIPLTATAVSFISAFVPRHEVSFDIAGGLPGEPRLEVPATPEEPG
jgi:predicted PurR-regulated permease PerM